MTYINDDFFNLAYINKNARKIKIHNTIDESKQYLTRICVKYLYCFTQTKLNYRYKFSILLGILVEFP